MILLKTSGKGMLSSGNAFQQNGLFECVIDTQYAGTNDDHSYAVPLDLAGEYDCTIYWGDGSHTHITDNPEDAVHTYAAIGVYSITISGKCWGYSHAQYSFDPSKLLAITQWGHELKLGIYAYGLASCFKDCDHLTEIMALDAPVLLSGIIDATSMFGNCILLTEITAISRWDVSNIQTFDAMFENCGAFTGVGIGAWNMSSAVNINSMFYNCASFNQNLGSWDVSNVAGFAAMFYGCLSFVGTGLGSWDMSSATYTGSMFEACAVFNTDLDGWNLSSNENMEQMFQNCEAFNNGLASGVAGTMDWTLGSCLATPYMFRNCYAFNQNIGSWDMSTVTDPSYMFSGCYAFDNGGSDDINNWDTSSAVNFYFMFENCYSLNRDISGWNVEAASTFANMFSYAKSFRQDLSAWNPISATSFANFMTNMDINAGGSFTTYDNLLLGWAAKSLPTSLPFSASTKYSHLGLGGAAAGTGRAHLTAATNASPTPGKGWTIAGDVSGLCTFSNSSGLLVTYTGDRPTYSRVVFTGSNLPTGITAGTTYWTVRVSVTTARLATSLANAKVPTVIAYTNSGTTPHSCGIQAYVFTAVSNGGNINVILTTGGNMPSGRKVRFVTTDTLPAGLSVDTDYWIRRYNNTNGFVHANIIDAMLDNNAIAYTDAGTGTHEVIWQ